MFSMFSGKRWLVIGVLWMVLACGLKTTSDRGPKYGGTIRWVLAVAPQQFSPFSPVLWDYAATHLIFEGLVRYSDDDFRIEPALATSWRTSSDGLTWTFQLRPGVKFHDGTPFNATAVKFNFERLLHNDHPQAPPEIVGSEMKSWSLVTIRRIDTPSEYEIVFTLEKPFAFLLDMLCLGNACITSPASVVAWGDQVKYHPVGSGPFKLVDYVPNRFCRLEANPDYYAGRPYVDAVEFHARRNIHPGFNLELISGAFDGALYLGPVEADLRRDNRIAIETLTGLNENYFMLNLTRPPFNNKLVRQALRHAFDQEALCRRLSRNTNEPAISILPSPFLPENARSRPVYSYNPPMARQLLAQAGYPAGLTVTIMENYSFLEAATAGHVYHLGRFLEHAGITLEIDYGMSTDTFWRRVDQHDYDIILTQHFSESGNAVLFLQSLLEFSITESGTSSRVNNDRIEQNFLDLLYSPGASPDEITRVVTDIDDVLEDEAYVFPYDNISNRAVYSTRLKGFKLHPLMARYNFVRVWKEE